MVKKKHFVQNGLYFYISVFLLNLVFYYLKVFQTSWLQYAQFNGLFILINCIIFIYLYKQITNKLITPFIILYVIFILFTSGQILLFGFNVDLNEMSYFWRSGNYSTLSIIKTIFFNTSSILLFQIGYYLSKFRFIKLFKKEHKIKMHMNLYDFTKIFYLIAITCSMVFCFILKITASSYADIYTQSYGKYYDILLGIANFSIPLYLIIQYRGNNLWKNFSNITIIIVIIFNFFIGRRGASMTYLIPVIFANSEYIKVKKLKIKNILSFILTGYVLISIIYTVSIVRVSNYTILESLHVFFNSLISFSSIKYVIIEMGFSIRPLLEIVNTDILVNLNYKYGATYIYSIFLILPGFFRFGLDKIAINNGLINLSSVVTKLSGANYGIGSSPQMEAYYNFSMYGILIFVFIGFIIGRILEKNYFKSNKYSFYFQICTLSFIILFPRSALQDLLKKFVYYCLIPFIINTDLQQERGK